MRYILLVAFLVGCGSGSEPIMTGTAGTSWDGTGGTTGAAGTTSIAGTGGGNEWPMVGSLSWDAWLSRGTIPSCNGPMVFTLTVPCQNCRGTAMGSWNCVQSAVECLYVHTYIDAAFECISFSGPVTGFIDPSLAFQLDLTTEPGFFVRVTGTVGSTGMVGTAQFSDASVPFVAFPL